MGASLLAIAVYQSTSKLNIKSHSRAGSLPQGSLRCRSVILFVVRHRQIVQVPTGQGQETRSRPDVFV
ncbi:hypothetical protein DOZ80_06790 [Pseudomonas fluorescens]|uniref:Uncharacterized protein n=1 Tax=Pseudomonas fluorescens TaxID=294 RepID=A0A327N9J2_PSEFL|nr:hypothetical protein DOZ80_06790 [Pseudomonas fluorescens]